MKTISKNSMGKVEIALGCAYEVIRSGVSGSAHQVPTPAFIALTACFTNIAVELGIDLIAAAEKARRVQNEPFGFILQKVHHHERNHRG